MLNREQIEQTLRDTCPLCERREAVKLRSETGEHVHVSYSYSGFSSTLCMATDLRHKYRAVLNG